MTYECTLKPSILLFFSFAFIHTPSICLSLHGLHVTLYAFLHGITLNIGLQEFHPTVVSRPFLDCIQNMLSHSGFFQMPKIILIPNTFDLSSDAKHNGRVSHLLCKSDKTYLRTFNSISYSLYLPFKSILMLGKDPKT